MSHRLQVDGGEGSVTSCGTLSLLLLLLRLLFFSQEDIRTHNQVAAVQWWEPDTRRVMRKGAVIAARFSRRPSEVPGWRDINTSNACDCGFVLL